MSTAPRCSCGKCLYEGGEWHALVWRRQKWQWMRARNWCCTSCLNILRKDGTVGSKEEAMAATEKARKTGDARAAATKAIQPLPEEPL